MRFYCNCSYICISHVDHIGKQLVWDFIEAVEVILHLAAVGQFVTGRLEPFLLNQVQTGILKEETHQVLNHFSLIRFKLAFWKKEHLISWTTPAASGSNWYSENWYSERSKMLGLKPFQLNLVQTGILKEVTHYV